MMNIRTVAVAVVIATAGVGPVHALSPGDPALFNQVSPEMAPGGVDRTGQKDATAAIQWAEDEAGKTCGTVVLTGRYLQDSADIKAPECVATVGANGHWPGAFWPDRDYTHTQSTLVQNPAYTFRMSNNSSVQRLTFQRKGLAPPRSFRDLVALTTSFAGIAITGAEDSLVRDVLVLGYDTCVSSRHHARFWLEDVQGDCTTGFVLDNAHDIAGIRSGEFYPFLTFNTRWSEARWRVKAVTDDGHGQPLLTLDDGSIADAHLATGDLVSVFELGGLPELTRSWRVAVRGTDRIVLEGAHYGAGYQGGGTVGFEDGRRAGDAVRVTHSEGGSISNVFSFGHEVGFHNGAGATGTLYVSDGVDNDPRTRDPATVGYLEDGKDSWAAWSGGGIVAQTTLIRINRSPGSYPATTTFTALGSFGPTYADAFLLVLASGRLTMIGVPSGGEGGRIFVGNGADQLIVVGGDWWGKPRLITETAADASRITVVATPGIGR